MAVRKDFFIDGKIAEVIVEEMLRDMGYDVYRHGYENITQHLSHADMPYDDVSLVIRNTPDFVVLKDNKPIFVEVKFRRNLSYSYPLQWDNVYVIFVTLQEPVFRVKFFPKRTDVRFDTDDWISLEKSDLFLQSEGFNILVFKDLVSKHLGKIIKQEKKADKIEEETDDEFYRQLYYAGVLDEEELQAYGVNL